MAHVLLLRPVSANFLAALSPPHILLTSFTHPVRRTFRFPISGGSQIVLLAFGVVRVADT